MQAAARAAGESADTAAAETVGLADDADLPLPQLLARYGMVMQGPGARPAASSSHPCASSAAQHAVLLCMLQLLLLVSNVFGTTKSMCSKGCWDQLK